MKLPNKLTLLSIITITILLISIVGCKKKEETFSLYTNNSNLVFDYDESRKSIVFSNISENNINWTVEANDEFIYFDKKSGSLGSNNTQSLDFILSRDMISGDSIVSKVIINSSEGDNIEFRVRINNYPEEKIRLGYKVRDADYCKSQNSLFLLPNNSSDFIEVLSIKEKKFSRIEIPGNIRLDNITISYNEKYVGMFGDKYVLLLDIATNKITGEHYIGTEISSIVFAPGNKLYIFPNYSNSIDMYCLNTETGNLQEFDIASFYNDDLKAKLHPSEKYIYAVDDYYYGLMKFNIVNTEPELVYKENTQGFEDDIWISDDGTQLFSRSNTYLNIDAELPGNDILSSVSFDFNFGFINDIDYNELKNEYYIVPDYDNYTPTDRFLVFDENLTFKETIYSEDFIYIQYGQTEYNYYKALVRRVFVTADNLKIITLTTPENGNYYNLGEAIEIISR